MFLLIKFTLLYAVVLMLVAMGGMFSERSGVINIALEGIMAIGGLAGVFVLVLFPDLPAPALVALSILASAVSGMIYSLLLGFSAITLKADQTIGGTALNMLATAIAIVLVKAFNNGSDAGNGAASAKLNYTNAAFIYKIGPFTVNIFLFIGIILLICSYVFLFKTKWGLRCVPAVSIHRQPTLLVSTYTSGDTPVLSSPVHSAVSADLPTSFRPLPPGTSKSA